MVFNNQLYTIRRLEGQQLGTFECSEIGYLQFYVGIIFNVSFIHQAYPTL